MIFSKNIDIDDKLPDTIIKIKTHLSRISKEIQPICVATSVTINLVCRYDVKNKSLLSHNIGDFVNYMYVRVLTIVV